MVRVGVALVAAALLAAATGEAQELEPRAYTNTPVGMNFLVLGYAYTKGDVALDTSAPIEDGNITVHNAFLAYVRSLDVWGRSGKLQLVLPYAWLSGSTKIAGQPVATEITPPSTSNTRPVTPPDSSLASHTTSGDTFAGSIASKPESGLAIDANTFSVIWVRAAGAMAFTVTP